MPSSIPASRSTICERAADHSGLTRRSQRVRCRPATLLAPRAASPQLRARRRAEPAGARLRRCCRWSGRRGRPTRSTSPRSCRPPSAAHWLGTDAFGRDIVSLLLAGARSTILVGIIAVGIGLTFGVASACSRRRKRGWTEEIIMRFSDFTFAFPAVLSAIMLAAVFGAGHGQRSIIAIGIFQHPDLRPPDARLGQRDLGARIRAGRARLRARASSASPSSMCCPTSCRC